MQAGNNAQRADAIRAKEIEEALFQMAKGDYVVEETKITLDAKQQESTVITRKKLPPDLAAAKFVLQAVDPERWGGTERLSEPDASAVPNVPAVPAIDPFVEALGRAAMDIFGASGREDES